MLCIAYIIVLYCIVYVLKYILRHMLCIAYVWNVALYGCETWTVGKEEEGKLISFEQWCYRRMMKISWKDRIKNEEVFRRAGEKHTVWKSIKNRKTNLSGHILRHESLIKTILEGMVEGKRYQGRPRLQYLEHIMQVAEKATLT